MARPELAAVLLAALLAACEQQQPDLKPIRPVRTLTVTADLIELNNVYADEVRARHESVLGFRVAGKIESRDASLGDRVRAGQLLARLDAGDLALEADSARAALVAQQAQLALDRTDYQRARKLSDQQVIARASFDQYEVRLNASEQRLKAL